MIQYWTSSSSFSEYFYMFVVWEPKWWVMRCGCGLPLYVLFGEFEKNVFACYTNLGDFLLISYYKLTNLGDEMKLKCSGDIGEYTFVARLTSMSFWWEIEAVSTDFESRYLLSVVFTTKFALFFVKSSSGLFLDSDYIVVIGSLTLESSKLRFKVLNFVFYLFFDDLTFSIIKSLFNYTVEFLWLLLAFTNFGRCCFLPSAM